MVDMITCSFPQEVHSIGIVMRHRTEMIASILAVLKCGGRYVPAEPDFPTGRIHDMMTEAQVDFVLTEHAFAPKLSSFPIRYTDCEICGVETPSWKHNAIEDPERPAYDHRAAQRCLCHQPQCLPLCPCLCQRVPSRPRWQAIVRAFTDEDGLSYMTAYVVPSDNKLKVSEVKSFL